MMLQPLAFLGSLVGPDLIVIMLFLAPFVIDILLIVEILKSRADPVTKLLWVIVVWFIPWIGLLLYLTIGRKTVLLDPGANPESIQPAKNPAR